MFDEARCGLKLDRRDLLQRHGCAELRRDVHPIELRDARSAVGWKLQHYVVVLTFLIAVSCCLDAGEAGSNGLIDEGERHTEQACLFAVDRDAHVGREAIGEVVDLGGSRRVPQDLFDARGLASQHVEVVSDHRDLDRCCDRGALKKLLDLDARAG